MLQSVFLHEIFVFIVAVFDREILVEQIHIEFIKTINAICKYHSFNFVTIATILVSMWAYFAPTASGQYNANI